MKVGDSLLCMQRGQDSVLSHLSLLDRVNSEDLLVYVQHCSVLQSHSPTVQHPLSITLHCLLLLVWHAPLGVHSARRRHQSPEWTILSHSYRFIQ